MLSNSCFWKKHGWLTDVLLFILDISALLCPESPNESLNHPEHLFPSSVIVFFLDLLWVHAQITVVLQMYSWHSYNSISCVHHTTNHTSETGRIHFDAIAWLETKSKWRLLRLSRTTWVKCKPFYAVNLFFGSSIIPYSMYSIGSQRIHWMDWA